MSETFGREEKASCCPSIPGYIPWASERKGSEKGGGGLTILFKESLVTHKWEPEVPSDLKYIEKERQWLMIKHGQSKCAFLHCYAACVNHQDKDQSYLRWNNDLFQLLTNEAKSLKREGFMILAMGDFNTRVGRLPGMSENTPDTNDNQPLFMNFVEEVNLVIINTLPVSRGLFTRFMDHGGVTVSKSVLDYGLVDADNVESVSQFYIDENARYRCGSDHALLECEIVFKTRPKLVWKVSEVLQYNFSNKKKLIKYQLELDRQISQIKFADFEQQSSSEMLSHLTFILHDSAKEALGVRIKKRKKGVKLPKQIIDLIKQKTKFQEEMRTAGGAIDVFGVTF